jgi:hypothetical protein
MLRGAQNWFRREPLNRCSTTARTIGFAEMSKGQPSIAAINEALPPAAVVSMQVTRSVAKRGT